MSKGRTVYLVYQKDFSEAGKDRYFIYDGEAFSEVCSEDVVALDCFVVTHDFWLISSSLFKKHGGLPSKVIDVVLLSKVVAGVKSIDGDVQPWDVSKTIKPLFKMGLACFNSVLVSGLVILAIIPVTPIKDLCNKGFSFFSNPWYSSPRFGLLIGLLKNKILQGIVGRYKTK